MPHHTVPQLKCVCVCVCVRVCVCGCMCLRESEAFKYQPELIQMFLQLCGCNFTIIVLALWQSPFSFHQKCKSKYVALFNNKLT